MTNKIIISLIVLGSIFGGWLVYSNNIQPEIIEQPIIDNIKEEILVVEGPNIKVDPDVHDLGIVIYGDVPERIFKITNLGNEPLEILKLSTSCGCTKASIVDNDKVIAPGASVDMLVTFDPAVHKDNSDLGDLVRVIYIKTNDPNNPEIEVEITANVIKQE